MLGGFMKNVPAALRESVEKLKGSMLLSMAKGMTSNDAEMMARHWGYVPQPKAEPVKYVETERVVLPERVIPDRKVLEMMYIKPDAVPDVVKIEPIVEQNVALVVSKVTSALSAPEIVKELPVEKNKLVAPEIVKEIIVEKSELIDESLDHPVFGKRIASLGYKNVYLTSVSALTTTQVWERQRTLRPDRAARIAASKVALGRTSSLSGVITMFVDKATGKSGIVDGQHRAGALMLLSQGGHWDGLEQNILIDVFETENEDQVIALFKEINSAEPVRLVDMPGEGASVQVKEILDRSVENLASEFKEMFRPSLRCKPPHLHEAIFRDELFQSGVVERRGLKSHSSLELLIQNANTKYSKRTLQEWENILLGSRAFKTKGKQLTDAVTKAQSNKFFIGLDNSWMYEDNSPNEKK